MQNYYYYYYLFLSGFSFADTDNSQRNIFYSTVPIPPAHEHAMMV